MIMQCFIRMCFNLPLPLNELLCVFKICSQELTLNSFKTFNCYKTANDFALLLCVVCLDLHTIEIIQTFEEGEENNEL